MDLEDKDGGREEIREGGTPGENAMQVAGREKERSLCVLGELGESIWFNSSQHPVPSPESNHLTYLPSST